MRSRHVLVVLACAASLVACESILGLDKFDKCDACGGDASTDVALDVALDVSNDVALPDGGSDAMLWARWRIENTPLEVEAGASEASLVNITGTGPFQDNVTGLEWSQTLGTVQSPQQAKDYCANLTPTGAWRVPTRIELVTLLDSTIDGGPYITPKLAPTVGTTSLLWTSSGVPPSPPTKYWFVSMTTGDVLQGAAATTGGVLCVH